MATAPLKVTLTVSKEELELLEAGIELLMDSANKIARYSENHIDHGYRHVRNSLYLKISAARGSFRPAVKVQEKSDE